ncbi:GTP cyclohydrolase 1 type 2/Nif3 like protein [Aduncisulcus paluster]|uniref:GTP cyclohydrolase 1 type 2/Nif3 like protein n=1 Tax=Aduncisulcus paluster TaxID=2918883 RepID=A0ABQ5KSF1_9EUKA|nr:GTP cyclohydrolase 1 type 2/Nif3 like protein [Aduncisulcus paluster]
MNVSDIISYIEEHFPLSWAESWDNAGFLVGDKSQRITKVLTCLDITDEVVNEAIEKKCEMIVSHHPLIFSGLKRVVASDFSSGIVYKLIKNSISVACYHTNVDAAIDGTNGEFVSRLCEELKISYDLSSIHAKKDDEDPRYLGVGGIITLSEETNLSSLSKCAHKVLRDAGSVDVIRCAGAPETPIKKIAICTGSGFSVVSKVVAGVDCVITGDSKYHETQTLLKRGACLCDCGHHGTEIMFREMMASFLKKKFASLEILPSSSEDSVFWSEMDK